MTPNRPALIPLAVLLLLMGGASLPQALRAGDWTQFRGPDRNGHSQETGLTQGWDETGPPELWRVAIGPAFSGITVVGQRLFTADSDPEHEYVAAFDAETGRQVWRATIGGLFENDYGDGPRSTPTWDQGKLFVVSSQGHLHALSAENGESLWKVELQEAFASERPRWAFTTSPLVLGDSVVAEIGGSEDRTVAAFDKGTGELRWTAGRGGTSYSSPIIVPFNGITQIVHLVQEGVMALSPQGELLWSSEFVPDLSIKPASPVFVEPDLVFISASYEAGAKAVRMLPDGESVRVEEVWEDRFMRNHFNASVAVDGHICGFDKATLKCIEAATGKQTWARRGLGKGSLIVADGKFLVLSERGKLLLLEANPQQPTELASHQVLTGRSWTQPSLANGRLYLRNRSEMVCLDLSRPES